MTENIFDCEVIFKQHKLSRSTLEQLKERFKDIEKYPDCHCNFDCEDKSGNIADVYLFQREGKLFARGKKYTQVLRNPDDVYLFLSRNKRVKKVTLVFK